MSLFPWANPTRLDANFDSTQFQKKYLNPSSYAKVMTVLPKRIQVTVDKNVLYVTAKVDPMDGKAQIGFHNESRVGEARVHTRRLAKANRLMWWIGLLFGEVESVSGTNKARSKILKLRTRI
jgi:hypothetical protein